MTEYKNMATMEANETKADNYCKRSSERTKNKCRVIVIVCKSAKFWKTVLAQEIVLEPKR